MSLKDAAVATILVTTLAVPVQAWALGGGAGGGCVGLPEYYRAQGALQGLPNCDMTVEQARRVIAAQDGPTAANGQVAPAPAPRHRRHRTRVPQQP